MTLSILAVFFLLMLVAIIFYGYGFIMRSTKPVLQNNIEPCTICKRQFERQQLVEREIGDSKLIYFCKACVVRLYDDVSKI
jgi:hypothetical protein